MSIPPFEVFLRPTLVAVADKGTVKAARHAILEPLASELRLSPEECEEQLESGGSRLASRCGWALTYLTKAGLIVFPKRGQAQITDEGRRFLEERKDNFGIKDLEQFPDFLKFREISSPGDVKPGAQAESNNASDILTPDERIQTAVEQIKQALAVDLLSILLNCSPVFFEQLVIELIQKMGYGRSEQSLTHTGGSGDFGIDGIISLDTLGFDKIYLQAKRWQGTVGQAVLRDFCGALAFQRASKGVVLTTSTFSADARTYADRTEKTLVLIDGDRLCDLMIEHGVGVQHRHIKVPALDEGYFEQTSFLPRE